MKRIFFISVISLLLFSAVSAAWYITKLHTAGRAVPAIPTPANNAVKEKLTGMAYRARQYAMAKQMNSRVCFLIDMQVASGKKRFFVYDLKQNKVLLSGLVTHGNCNQAWLAGRKFGNEEGCGCSSLGKYSIGRPYQGKFGLAYKLYGLDTTNSNAYNRFVVLHAMQCVPEKEVDPYPVCQSNGCPAVSPDFLQALAPLIDNSKQPVLLWIF